MFLNLREKVNTYKELKDFGHILQARKQESQFIYITKDVIEKLKHTYEKNNNHSPNSHTSGSSEVTYKDKEHIYAIKFGSKGSGNGQFKFPKGIAVDSSGNVYVADDGNCRIQKF